MWDVCNNTDEHNMNEKRWLNFPSHQGDCVNKRKELVGPARSWLRWFYSDLIRRLADQQSTEHQGKRRALAL